VFIQVFIRLIYIFECWFRGPEKRFPTRFPPFFDSCNVAVFHFPHFFCILLTQIVLIQMWRDCLLEYPWNYWRIRTLLTYFHLKRRFSLDNLSDDTCDSVIFLNADSEVQKNVFPHVFRLSSTLATLLHFIKNVNNNIIYNHIQVFYYIFFITYFLSSYWIFRRNNIKVLYFCLYNIIVWFQFFTYFYRW
jgi:hypothetical protein